MHSKPSDKRCQCSVCSKAIDIHQQVRGGICDDVSCRATASKLAISRRYAEQKAAKEAIARKHLTTLLEGAELGDGNPALIVLLGSTASLKSPSSERRERFRQNVTAAVQSSSAAHRDDANRYANDVSTVQPSAVLSSACGACRGECCRNGGDKGYINDETVGRLRALQPRMSDEEIIARYMNAIPELTVDESCILHGEQGCALPRELRSNVCNSFYCRPLHDWARESAGKAAQITAVVVLNESEVIRSTLVSE